MSAWAMAAVRDYAAWSCIVRCLVVLELVLLPEHALFYSESEEQH